MTPYAMQQLLRMETSARFPFFIEIIHPELGTFRYVNADEAKTFDSETYEPALFSVTPPETTETSIGNAMLSISSVDQTWIEKIRSVQDRFSVRFVAALEYDDDGTETIEPLEDNEFTLTEASWTDLTITWTMVFEDAFNILVPCDIATSQKVSGCA